MAAFDDADVARLLQDAGIIRNRLKVAAAIHNAGVIQGFQNGFAGWLDDHHPLSKEEWVKLFKKTFKFTGGEIVNEFLMSLGHLRGAHDARCPVFGRIQGAPWQSVAE